MMKDTGSHYAMNAMNESTETSTGPGKTTSSPPLVNGTQETLSVHRMGEKGWVRIIDAGIVVQRGNGWVKIWDSKNKDANRLPENAEWFPESSRMVRCE
jgi:hypothetical protein